MTESMRPQLCCSRSQPWIKKGLTGPHGVVSIRESCGDPSKGSAVGQRPDAPLYAGNLVVEALGGQAPVAGHRDGRDKLLSASQNAGPALRPVQPEKA